MNATDTTRRAVAYLRVSTEDQNLGPDAQRAAIERWAEAEGVEVVAWFEDHGVSGGAPLDKRPELMAAVGILPELGAELLVVAKRDRLARDTMAAAMIERLVEKAGARIMTANGVGNGDSPEALLMRRMIDAFAEYERMVIKARTKAALAVKKARGERVGEVPYGQRAEGSRLVPDEAEAELVTIVVSLRAAGMSYRKIAAELEARGLRNRKGNPLAANQVVRIMKRAA